MTVIDRRYARAPTASGRSSAASCSLARRIAGGRAEVPGFPDPRLKQGRAIWLGTCEACHANDVAGAPLVGNKGAWAPRLAKGKEALYKSALGGLTGPKGTQMPPRGGNDKLTDDQVRMAVDYMAAIVSDEPGGMTYAKRSVGFEHHPDGDRRRDIPVGGRRREPEGRRCRGHGRRRVRLARPPVLDRHRGRRRHLVRHAVGLADRRPRHGRGQARRRDPRDGPPVALDARPGHGQGRAAGGVRGHRDRT